MSLILAVINWGGIGIIVALMLGISVVLGILILLVGKFFEVKNDTRVDEIVALLPKANCGGCGQAGCAAFAKALLEGKVKPDDCKPAKKEVKIEIANILGQSFSGGEETVAQVVCAGGDKCNDKYSYQGYGTCVTQAMLNGGRKACQAGCLGAGSCARVCPNEAIKIIGGVAVVDESLCISCGLCILECPKNIIKRIPKSAKIFVACSTLSKGKEVMAACKNGCISCGLCEKNCPEGAIHLVNNVPVIDYSKCTACFKCVEKCPRKVIKKRG